MKLKVTPGGDLMSRDRKRAPCPFCLPNGRADYKLESEFKDGVWLRFWACSNCMHRRPIGKSTARVKKQRALIERARAAVENADTHGSDKLRFEWKETAHENGDITVQVSGRYGPETSMLSVVSYRCLGMRFTVGGGINVFYDSKIKGEDKKQLKSVEDQLRRGRLYFW